MAISLYDASVSTPLQVLGAMRVVLDKGLAHCRENRIDPASVVETRLYPDMNPFSFQVREVATLPLITLAAIKAGKMTLPLPPKPEYDYAGLQTLVAETESALRAITAAEVDALEGRDFLLEAGPYSSRFTTEGFVMSFSTPNVFFHATTAYAILRSKGVPVGKMDFIGVLQTLA